MKKTYGKYTGLFDISMLTNCIKIEYKLITF